MIDKFVIASMLTVAGLAAQAQGTPPAASAPVSSAAKKELVAKVLKLQQPGLEGFARNIVQQNAVQVLQAAGAAVQQRVTAERRDAVWQDIQADARKFADETFPIVRDRALKLGPTTLGPMLEERFNEDELRQLIGIMESPVGKKFAAMNGEIMKTLGEKLMPDVRPLVEPKMKAFQQSVATRLGAPASAPQGSGK